MTWGKFVLYLGYLFFAFMILNALIQTWYRYRHPEMTETQLTLNFFEAYKEIFGK